jgi:hypothetical protein
MHARHEKRKTVAVRPGSRFRSTTGTAEIVVVRAPDDDLSLECAGQPMVAADDPGAAETGVDEIDPDTAVLLGKRYEQPDLGLEVLCVKGGQGPLMANGSELVIKGSKPLPSSD